MQDKKREESRRVQGDGAGVEMGKNRKEGKGERSLKQKGRCVVNDDGRREATMQ